VKAVLPVLVLAFAPLAAWAQPRPPPTLEQTGVSPDGPPSPSDIAYENRIRASLAAAQSLQGPLDGPWTLFDAKGQALYVFQLVDPAGGRGPLEGVWRDPHRTPGGDGIGVVDFMQRAGARVSLLFAPHADGAAIAIQLQPDPLGGWRGQIIENGQARAVVMRRN
jgi:hypothetical protein